MERFTPAVPSLFFTSASSHAWIGIKNHPLAPTPVALYTGLSVYS
ncbi:hypothetical protein [Siminovitchia sp. FSL W7-1587]